MISPAVRAVLFVLPEEQYYKTCSKSGMNNPAVRAVI
jgi:hypothetical protein